MQTVNIMRRAMGLICLSMLLIQGMGCSKMIANYNLSSALKRVEEAKKLDALQLVPNDLQKANNDTGMTQKKLDMQDFKGALAASKDAAQSSKDLLLNAKKAKMTDLNKQAQKILKIADLNDARTINQIQYAKYQEDFNLALKYRDKESYDKAIKTFQSVVDNITILLSNLKDESEKNYKSAQAMLEEMKKEGADKYAADYVSQMKQLISDISDLNLKDQNYQAAKQKFYAAEQCRNDGIKKTKEARAKEQLREIENQLSMASELGAQIYATLNFNMCSKEYENVLGMVMGGNYDTMLAEAEVFKPKIRALILETKENVARAKAKEVEQAINSLKDSNAEKYLPGKIEQLQFVLDEANKSLALKNEKGFDDSKKASERALEMNKSFLEEFNSLAEKEIKTANDVLAVSENVFRTMQGIFDKQIKGAMTPEDQRLEDAKQSMKQELGVSLQNSGLSLQMATTKREEKDFDMAIETARQVAKDAENVHQQTYRVVAHNAIIEIGNKLNDLERDGGRQYAAAETDKTLKLLEGAKAQLHGGKYLDAVTQAEETKAQLSVLIQELERVAVSKIEDAQSTLAKAKSNRAEQYQNESFNQAIVSLDRAKAALEGEGLKQAIDLSTQAKNVAEDASDKSLKQWTVEEIRRADILLEKGRAAGAPHYAPQKFQKALDMRNTLQSLFEQGAWQQAIQQGEQTVESADSAFFAKVIEAEGEIATAKRYDGFEQEPQKLTDAIVSAQNARTKMGEGKYDIGLQHAQASITVARDVAVKAKRKSFEARMAALNKRLETAQTEGAGYFQSKDLTQVLGDMNRMRDDFDKTSYEDLTQGVDKLESQLAGVMEKTPDVLSNLVGTLQTRLADLEKRRAKMLMPDQIDAVERKIKFAQLDFKSEKYRSSYMNAKDASRLMDAIQLNLDEREFDHALHLQLQAFNRSLEKFATVLNLGSPALIQMSTTVSGRTRAVAIMNSQSPSDLVTQIKEIGVRVQGIQAPRTRMGHKEAALKMLNLAVTASANFQKLVILDQFNLKDARMIIETAFLQMYQARAQMQDIERGLKYPLTDLQPRGVERVVSYHGE